MRRKDRKIDYEEARSLLAAGEYGIISMTGPDGTPYGVPVNYCVVADAIYFHCAESGLKLDSIAADNRVSFCVVGQTEIQPEKFSTRYESVIVSGRALEVDGDEKQLALEGLLDKYSAQFRTEGLAYIAKLWQKTKVFKITIEGITGKAHR